MSANHGLAAALGELETPMAIGRTDGAWRSVEGPGGCRDDEAFVPPVSLRSLGDSSFVERYGLAAPYVAGAMATGIASEELVESLCNKGYLAFFGAAGLSEERVNQAVSRLSESCGTDKFGCNLIYSPSEGDLEDRISRLYSNRGVRVIEASAYMKLTAPVVRYRLAGLSLRADGSIARKGLIFAKVSRAEVAEKFLSPAPESIVKELLARNEITELQARLSQQVPVADEITAEADSGGHTDNRPALTLIPSMKALRDRLCERYSYTFRPSIGAAGGISTPESVAAAYSMGAGFVVTGSVNQACVEAGTSSAAKELLATVQGADVVMAPASDMFEMGVKVQVVKRGTMFAMRAGKLFELYRRHSSIAEIPVKDKTMLEGQIFKKPLAEAWRDVENYFTSRDPETLLRAEKDPHHKMSLLFRSYLGQASKWAVAGQEDRKIDYQVWCGPAMGAFNEWTKGTFLESPKERRVDVVALNLLYGAAVLARARVLSLQGVDIGSLGSLPPKKEEDLAKYLH